MSRNARIRQLQIVTPEEELENLRNEVGVLKRTVESKSAAVAILRAELQECQRERDKFRTLAEDETLHRSSASSVSKKPAYSDPCRSAMLSGSEGTLAQLLSISKEENKTLRLDCTELRCKLHDAQADIKVLREEMQRLRGAAEGRRQSHVLTATSQLAHQEREQFISQMESLSSKCQALEGDVRGLVEEREELVRELDASSHKIHRLNHILNTILSSASSAPDVVQPKRLVDLDAIITENRYLQERLKQTEEEKNLVRSNALKYKTALEKCRTQGSLKLGTPENLIVTPKQVAELLRDYHGEVGGAAETDLKSLCVALVDALNQRSRALRTQRSANKVLANRVSELERRILGVRNPDGTKVADSIGKGGESSEPQISSLGLMEGYIPPSGPIPKYSEETVMRDPRLNQLLSSNVVVGNLSKKDVNEDTIGVKNLEGNTECVFGKDKRNCNEEGKVDSIGALEDGNDSGMGDKLNETEEVCEVEKNEIVFDGSSIESECNKNGVVKHSHGVDQDSNTSEEIITTFETTVRKHDISAEAEKSSLNKVSDTNDKDTKSVVSGTEQKQRSCAKEISSKQSTKHKKVSTYINPEDELEEIVPIDQLDIYMKEIQLKRRFLKTSPTHGNKVDKTQQDKEVISKSPDKVKDSELRVKKETMSSSDKEIQEQPNIALGTTEDNDSSFDLDISDYDSDNDNLDLALQDWQNDFDKAHPGKREKTKKSKSSKAPAKKARSKEKFSFWQKDTSAQEAELSPALKEFIDRATAEVSDKGVDLT